METKEYRRESATGKLMPVEGHRETSLPEAMEEEPQLQLDLSYNRSHFIYYLKIFLDLGYFVLVIPFRFTLQYSRSTGRKVYKLHTNRMQQITCAVIQFVVVFELLSILRLLPSFKEMQKNPLNILHSANLVASLLYTISLIYIFWWKKEQIGSICEQLEDEENFSLVENSPKWKGLQVKVLVYLICIGAYLMAMTHPVIHEAFVFQANFSSFFERMFVQAKACFLMTDPNIEDNHIHFHDWRSLPAFLFTVIHTLILIPSAVLVHMLDLFAFLTTICCWDVMRNFMRKCRDADQSIQSGHEYLPTIISQYLALKKFFKTVNNGLGLLFLCCIGISLPIYATWIAVQFFANTVETYDAIHFYIYFVTFLFVVSMAARINQRANEFYDWIGSSELHTLLSPNKMTVLLMDLYSNRISISGSGLFVINYRFLVTILSIIVTYTSIIIQFQISRDDYVCGHQVENHTHLSTEIKHNVHHDLH